MITETVSFLNHIRICHYLLNINTVKKMDELLKLNTDLIEFWTSTTELIYGGLTHQIIKKTCTVHYNPCQSSQNDY